VDKQLRDAVCDFAGDSRHANPWAAELARMPRPTAGSADYTHEEIVCGRHIVREIWVRPGAGIKFPGIKQVFRIRRQVYDLSGQRLSKEYVHGVTSLDADRASAEQLLGLVRHHWRVEINHQIRDVACARTTSTPTQATAPESWPPSET